MVSLRNVEAMGFSADQGLTVDLLKDDRTITIVGTSGKEYQVSCKNQYDEYQRSHKDFTLDSARQAILERWQHLITKEKQ